MKKSKLVSFWSPYHGQSGQTLCLAATGSMLGVNHNISTLLMHTNFIRSNLESAFLPAYVDIKSRMLDDKGIDAVEKLARTKQLSEKNFMDYTTSLIPGKLEILSGTNKTNKESYTKIFDTLPYILACARQAFDIILCDVSSGMNSEITEFVLKNSDLVVVCLNQNQEVLNGFFLGKHVHPAIKANNSVILLGNYESESIFTKQFIKRVFKYKDEIYTLPRNISLLDAHNTHSLLRFFFTNSAIKVKDKNNDVICSLEKLVERILQDEKEESNEI